MPCGCNEYNYILKGKKSRYAYSNDYVDGYIPNENTYDLSEEEATYDPDILTKRAAFMVYPAEFDDEEVYKVIKPEDEFISMFGDSGGMCDTYARGYGRKKLYDEQIEDFSNLFASRKYDDILLYLFVLVVIVLVAFVLCWFAGRVEGIGMNRGVKGHRYC